MTAGYRGSPLRADLPRNSHGVRSTSKRPQKAKEPRTMTRSLSKIDSFL
jgi:hypothetical protein